MFNIELVKYLILLLGCQSVCSSNERASNTKVFLASGLGGTAASEVIDLADPSFSCRQLAPYPLEVTGAVGTVFGNRPLLCAGNVYSIGETPKDCYEYDFGTDSWTSSKANLQYGRWFPAATTLADGRWWVTGGSEAGLGGGIFYGTEILSTVGEFFEGPDLPEPKEDHCIVRIDESRTLLIGGGVVSDRVWMYDSREDLWYRQDPMKVGRRGHACGKITTPTGLKVIVGGGSNRDFLDSVEAFDVATLTWSDAPSLPKVLYGSRMIEFEGGLYMVGGTDDLYALTDVYVLDADTLEWSLNVVQLPNPREVFVPVVVPNDLVVGC